MKRRVLATVHVPCQDLEAIVNPDVATASVKRRKVDSSRFEITIAVNPQMPPGNFQTDAKISVVTSSDKRELAYILPIAGAMQPEIRLLPARVLLPPTPVGKTAEAIVTLQAPPEVKMVLDHIEIDEPGLRVEPATIDGIPAGHAYRLLQQVVKEGEQMSTARFFIRKSGQKILTLSVKVNIRGESMKKTATKITAENQP